MIRRRARRPRIQNKRRFRRSKQCGRMPLYRAKRLTAIGWRNVAAKRAPFRPRYWWRKTKLRRARPDGRY